MLATRTLYIYIARELLKIFVLAVVAITLVMNFGAAIIYLQRFPLPLSTLLKVLPYHTPNMLQWTFPLAMLLATTLTFGRLASDNEILAMQMSGMHLMRPAFPALAIGLVLTILLAVANDQLIPWCRMTENEVYKREAPNILKRVFQDRGSLTTKRFTITWGGLRGEMLKDVTVKERDEEHDIIIAEYTARRTFYSIEGDADNVVLKLEDISGTDFEQGVEINWPERTQRFPLEQIFSKDPGTKALTTRELLDYMDRNYGPTAPPPRSDWYARKRVRQIRGIWIDIHQRFSLASACMAFVLVGVPLGILARRAHMLSAFFLGCLPVMLVYYPVLLMGQSMALEGAISPWAACWTPGTILAAIGVSLMGWLFTR